VYAAKGDVITFLDADDELHPQKIELQLTLYRSNCAISCDVVRIGDERGADRVTPFKGKFKYSECKYSSKFVRRNILVGASLMISRSLFLDLGGYDRELRSCEDFDLWLRVLDAGVLVINIELPLYLYRVNKNGLSRNYLSISNWELVVVQKHIGRLAMRGEPMQDEALILFLWLFRHAVRYEQCKDARLLEFVNLKMALLDRWPLVQKTLIFLRSIGFVWLVARVRLIDSVR
jgi:glycosyltransferase involved in cell wall biosynthesis